MTPQAAICHLRFDDTNPTTEDPEYVQAIQDDVRWLGFDWHEKMFFASDYFEQLYDVAVRLIRKGKAYVDDLTAEEMRTYRGTLTQPGMNSPSRDRSVDENLDLFRRMRAGEFPDGTHVLRAKIDMSSPNINLRDPVLYRIRHAPHYRTGNTWCLYPSYDYAHPLSDAIEGITHSLCTLEFEDHRPLYDWVVEQAETPHRPQQIEFARLNLTYTVMSKRKLLELVEKKLVSGWDDPRLPTIKGLRRRGYTPEAIRAFCDHIGVAKREAIVEMQLLEHFIREDLNKRVAASDGRIASAQNHPRPTIPRASPKNWKPSTILRIRLQGRGTFPFHASSILSKTISGKIRPNNFSGSPQDAKYGSGMPTSSNVSE